MDGRESLFTLMVVPDDLQQGFQWAKDSVIRRFRLTEIKKVCCKNI